MPEDLLEECKNGQKAGNLAIKTIRETSFHVNAVLVTYPLNHRGRWGECFAITERKQQEAE